MTSIPRTNPFIKNLKIEVGREVTDINTYLKYKDKYDNNSNIPTIHLERTNKVFIYTNPSIRKILNSLSGSSAKLYLWIQQILTYGSDYFKFNSKKFLKEVKMSPTTLIKSKRELIEKDIIAEIIGYNKYYWINPAILFKGSRVKKYPENIIIFTNTNNSISSTKIND